MKTTKEVTCKSGPPLGGPSIIFPLLMMGAICIIFYVLVPAFPTYGRPSVAGWLTGAWNSETEFEHGWVVPILFILFMVEAWRRMVIEPINSSKWGLLIVVFGLLVYVASVRTIQPRLAMFGLPFIIFGVFYFLYGLRVQQATNLLQLVVTKACYEVGSFMGMKLVHSGNTITSAIDGWNSLNIAEGCSGIRSLIALLMISAIYAYFTQKKIWKGFFLFSCSLPMAVVANFLRIFTIIVFAEMGFSEFAAGVYHDWAGLLFFFPITLAGLMLIDKLINHRENRKRVVVRKVEA